MGETRRRSTSDIDKEEMSMEETRRRSTSDIERYSDAHASVAALLLARTPGIPNPNPHCSMQAYSVLSHPRKRLAYDQLGHSVYIARQRARKSSGGDGRGSRSRSRGRPLYSASSSVQSLSRGTFYSKVYKPTVVHFLDSTSRCTGRCRTFTAAFESVAQSFARRLRRVASAYVDCSVEQRLCAEQDLVRLPTLRLIWSQEGVLGEAPVGSSLSLLRVCMCARGRLH